MFRKEDEQNKQATPVKEHHPLLYVCGALFFLYVFLLSIGMMGTAFKLFGARFAEQLIAGCSNPVAGLFIGMLATSIIQSSSTITSLTVGFVGGGVLPLEFAIPIIMGANIGTSITNSIVSLGFVTRKDDFRRAFAGATVHDFFNLCSAAVLFPVEMKFHIIQKTAEKLTGIFGAAGGSTFASPVKLITKPVCKAFKHFLSDGISLSETSAGAVALVVAIAALICSLIMLVKLLRRVIVHRAERFINRHLFRNDATSLLLGLCLTIMVQSSSVTTSLVVPLVGAGILTLKRCFPFTLGANLGTTCTALLASLATVSAGENGCVGVTAAFAHLIFNVMGMAIFYPLKIIPITAATRLADLAAESKRWAIIFIIGIFFGLPLLMILATR